jgi:hypothetical protein
MSIIIKLSNLFLCKIPLDHIQTLSNEPNKPITQKFRSVAMFQNVTCKQMFHISFVGIYIIYLKTLSVLYKSQFDVCFLSLKKWMCKSELTSGKTLKLRNTVDIFHCCDLVSSTEK